MSSQVRSRVTHLDGLRGVAILAVFAVHWIGPRVPGLEGGYIGVDVFFVLSGFIITTLLLRRRPSYREFMRDRVRRLYPPLLGLLAIGTLLAAVWPDGALSLGQTAESAAVSVVQGASPYRAAGFGSLNPFGITWSLAIEWYFYLLWPLAVIWLRAMSPARALQIVVAAAAVLYALSLLQSAEWFYYGPAARFPELMAGAGLAFWMHERERPPMAHSGLVVLSWLAPVFIGGWTLLGPTLTHPAYRWVGLPGAVITTLALIAVGYSKAGHPVLRALGWRPLVGVGLVSYSLYLWHMMPLLLMHSSWMELPTPVVAVIGLGLVVVATGVAYVACEKPFRHNRTREVAYDTAPR